MLLRQRGGTPIASSTSPWQNHGMLEHIPRIQKSPLYSEELLWYCVKAKPKQEGVAARLLRYELRLEVFCPKVRFKRARSTGIAWVHEAMFPGYLFVRFIYPELYRRVAAMNGVAKTLAFGGRPCVIGQSIIDDLRRHVSDGETVEISAELRKGEEVKIVDGPFLGIRALVTRILPAQDRVAILLEMLGQQLEIEMSSAAVLPDMRHPLAG